MRDKFIWLVGLVTLLTFSCKHEEPKPGMTIIQGVTKDEKGNAVPKISIWILGNKGSYFAGSRVDTIFAKLETDSNGLLNYKQDIPSKWRVYFSPNGFPDYTLVKFEGTVDGIVNVGETNNIVAVLRKR